MKINGCGFWRWYVLHMYDRGSPFFIGWERLDGRRIDRVSWGFLAMREWCALVRAEAARRAL